MTDTVSLRLSQAWGQCQRHVRHLNHALQTLRALLPLDGPNLSNLTDEQVQHWDQFILRFTKLQDAMGAQLFPAALAFLQEPYDDRPMLDKLHRLEKLGYLPHTEDWQTWRALRNSFAHDYPEDDALKAAHLNQAVSVVPDMLHTLGLFEPLVQAATEP